MFKKSQDEIHGAANDEKKKSAVFKAQSSMGENDEDCNEDESDEEMALFVRRFNKFMSKKSYGKKGQFSKNNLFVNKKCFECGEEGHIVIDYPNKKNDKNKKGKKDDDKKKKKFIKKKRNGQAYFVEWDFDISSDDDNDDDDDDDDKPSKSVAGIAIKKAPSLFSTPHCLMAKDGAKVSSPHHIVLWQKVVQ